MRRPRNGQAGAGSDPGVIPPDVQEYASQAVEYVRRAVGMTVEYDSETLPVVDHYLRSVPSDNAAAAHLVAAATGAYFGEVVRRRLGGAWDLPNGDPGSWRMVLPSGLWFSPAAMALAAIRGTDGHGGEGDGEEITNPNAHSLDSEWDPSLQVPAPLRALVADVLERMAEVSATDYYTLCCRLDALEHLQAVLTGLASTRGTE